MTLATGAINSCDIFVTICCIKSYDTTYSDISYV